MANTTATGGARRLPATAVLLVAAVLRTWRLHQNGYDNEYAAAVRSMSGAWHNFLHNSFDPGGFVSVDNPRSRSGSRSRA
jgi:4-amino-4-deoxy-L-arabinose transferase-like glycosyltransferase